MECNSTRIVGSLLVGGMGADMPVATTTPTSTVAAQNASSPSPSPGLMSSFSLLTSGKRPANAVTAPKAKSQLASLQKAASTVETVVYLWKRMMYGVAALLVATTLVSWMTGHTRAAHLAVAVVMMFATVATLAGMRIIEHPSAGDMPPLPLDRHILAVVALSAYTWIIVVAFATRVKPADFPPA